MLVFKCFLAHSSTQGSEERDVAFMERLRCLAREALSWAWLTPQQRLVWAAAIELDAVPLQELPPWFWERQNVTHRHPGVDLVSLDGHRAVRCIDGIDGIDIVEDAERFVQVAQEVHKAQNCTLVISTASTRLSEQSQAWLQQSGAEHRGISERDLQRLGSCELNVQSELVKRTQGLNKMSVYVMWTT
ncbi:Putative ATP-dependent helicase IRC3 [Durusdinium trenchii]|uniref:ATP-dependent helicase IRC3 n=1 Tax=Durusdinium trenchii TaxID=1381693 RepID=A0ABP0LDT1_9DINO